MSDDRLKNFGNQAASLTVSADTWAQLRGNTLSPQMRVEFMMTKIRMRAAGLVVAGLSFAGGLTVPAVASADPWQPNPGPTVQPLDCQGTTGVHGCGPGWYWRNGSNGWACYPC